MVVNRYGSKGRRMPSSITKLILGVAFASALAGCTTQDPNAASMVGRADISANTAPRGTPEFCKRYAEQTASNTYGTSSDLGADSGAEAQARISGGNAYERCLAGRLN